MGNDTATIKASQLRLAIDYINHLYCVMDESEPEAKEDLIQPDNYGCFGADPRVIKMLYVPTGGDRHDKLVSCWHLYAILSPSSGLDALVRRMVVSQETELFIQGTADQLVHHFTGDYHDPEKERQEHAKIRLQLRDAFASFLKAIACGEIAETDLRKA